MVEALFVALELDWR